MPTKYKVYLGLGGNLGDRNALLDQAESLLNQRAGRIIQRSSRYETEPVGFVSSHPFLNEVVALETPLEPLELLDCTEGIEQELGRRHKSLNGRYTDRPMDIDLLLAGDRLIDLPRLTVPHPRMHERKFVLEPLAEIAPELIHPGLQRSIQDLLNTWT
ncbi:MAG: 2-amino-4-hydroxy-6-hydroxymethyldihydropteridine diphosphokinase [Paludibacteraceae bacterium]|nr:2-amino-4-hydroxy-6-hydroxymethyldihydropteridine diphosphokinase [Paludibacteraceae bacterium]